MSVLMICVLSFLVILAFIFGIFEKQILFEITGLLTMVAGLVWCIGSIFDNKNVEYLNSFCEVENIEIISADLSESLYGDFLLGSGKIQNKESYSFYIYEGDGYKRFSIPVDKTIIMECSGSPHLQIEYYTLAKVTRSHFSYLMTGKNEEETTNVKVVKEYTLYVPKGTIVSSFSKLNK